MTTELEARKPSPRPRTSPASDERPVGAASATTGGWTRARRLLTGVLAVLVVPAGAGTWYLGSLPAPADVRPAVSPQGDYTPGSLPPTEAAAVRAVIDHVPRILSYDYRTLDKHVRSISGALTPEFAATFRDTFATAVRPIAKENRAVTKALVRGAGVTSMNDTKATVMLFLDQVLVTKRDVSTANPSIGRERVRVSLQLSGGRWLIDDITPM